MELPSYGKPLSSLRICLIWSIYETKLYRMCTENHCLSFLHDGFHVSGTRLLNDVLTKIRITNSAKCESVEFLIVSGVPLEHSMQVCAWYLINIHCALIRLVIRNLIMDTAAVCQPAYNSQYFEANNSTTDK